MKRQKNAPARLMIVLSIMTALNVSNFAQSNALRAPMTEKKTKTTKIHDDTMIDEYFWLREKSNPEVIAHLEAENAYSEAMMKPTAALQDKLYKEMVGHIKETDVSVPYRWGGYFYYTRTEQGKQYPISCRKKGSLDAKEEVVLDQNEMAKGLKFFSASAPSFRATMVICSPIQLTRPATVNIYCASKTCALVNFCRSPSNGREMWRGPPTTKQSSSPLKMPSPNDPTSSFGMFWEATRRI